MDFYVSNKTLILQFAYYFKAHSAWIWCFMMSDFRMELSNSRQSDRPGNGHTVKCHALSQPESSTDAGL